MTTAEIIASLKRAITDGNGFTWEKPKPIGNGDVAVYLRNTGFGIIAAPHRYSGAEYTVVYDDGTEYDYDSTFNNAQDAVMLAESL